MVLRQAEQGIALLLVIWVLTILMVIVFSFSLMARTETKATVAFSDGIERRLLAEAGIERAIMEIFYANQYRSQNVILEGREIWKTDGTSYTDQLGKGRYTVRIIDESGKVDLNALNDQNAIILKNLLMNAGVQDKDADTIVDSVLDWKDPDDLHRLNGAESDYYMALQNPYEAKNANFDTVEELALVKGVTSEVLYGGNDTKGIIDFLTVHSKSGMINMLAAPREVLLAIPGMTQELADDITSKRETPGPPDPQGIVPPPESLPYASLNYGSPASTFTVESFGQKGDEKGGHAIRATVVIELTNKPKFLYYKSPATLWQ